MLLGLTIVLLNGQASETRQHLAACYSVHLQDTRRTQGEISALKGHLHALRERNEALDIKLESSIKLKSNKELGEVRKCVDPVGGDAPTFSLKCQELIQRVTSFEVNEMVLKRRHAILQEELKAESDMRFKAEHALGEMEATLRSRILYLELWKQGASARVERLQAEVNESVPALQFSCVQDSR